MRKADKCYQCYYCNKFFIRPERQKRHTENCSEIPRVIYNFNHQNLISYQDKFNAKGDVLFVIYFDFETIAPTYNCLDPEQKKMFVVLFVMTTLNYFTREQITYVGPNLIKMLKDMVFEFSKRKHENSIGKMFSIESALVKKTLLKWFIKKFKQQFDKINPMKKLRYETENPVDWKKDKCVICKFPLKIQPTNFKTPDDNMSFVDFVIRYEHKFLRNIYTEKEIRDSHHV